MNRGREIGIQEFAAATRSDDSLKALVHILEAWEQGTSEGIAPELMAYAAIFTALTDLVAVFGEHAVSSMATGLSERILSGEFSLSSRRQ